MAEYLLSPLRKFERRIGNQSENNAVKQHEVVEQHEIHEQGDYEIGKGKQRGNTGEFIQ